MGNVENCYDKIISWKRDDFMFHTILLGLSDVINQEEIQGFIEAMKKKEGVHIDQITDATNLSQYDGEDTILITDMTEFFVRSYALKIPGVVYLHRQNRKMAFSNMTYAITSLEELPLEYLQRVYQRFFHIPWEILRTERCLVREITIEDVDELYEIYKDKDVVKYMENLFEDKEEEREYTRKYIENMYGFYGFGMWIVQRLDNGRIIGRAGLNVREEYEDLELGYLIRKDEQKKGYAKEVCEAILRYAVEELEVQDINAFIHPDNTESINLIYKLKFHKKDRVNLEERYLDRYVWNKNAIGEIAHGFS